MDLFTLSATIGLDSSEYERKIGEAIESAKELNETLGGVSGEGGTGFAQTVSTATTATGGFGSTVKAILASDIVRRGADAIGDFAKRSLNAASDLQEVQNVVDVTFGDMSGRVDAWAKTTKDDFGLTELQSKQYASRLGSMMKTAGLEMNEVYDMSTGLTQLAGDIASFFDTDFDAAYEKLQSGMSGQVRPLRDFGIDMTVAHLEDYAHEKGYEGDWKDMTEADQYRVRYDYLMAHTKDVQGDFARTSGSAANELRSFSNNVDALAAKIGDHFLPVVEAGAHAANGFFDALLTESTEDSLTGIDEAAAETATSIESTARQANAAIGVLEDLGDRSALTSEKQALWDGVMSDLLRTIPELGSLINEQTGEIEGGTAALRESAAAWEESGKAAANDSALQSKRDMLADVSADIAGEQAQIAIAQKAIEDASGGVIDLGYRVAAELGRDFDGTVQSAATLFDSIGGSMALQRLGIGWDELNAMFSPLEEAEGQLAEHQEKLDELEEKYNTIQTSVDSSTQGMSQSVGDAQTEIGETLDQIEEDTDSAIANFDQSAAAYANAHATGLAAANGLNDAYPAYEEAANRYAQKSFGGGQSDGTGGAGRSFDPPPATTSSNADGLSYVPYNDYLSYLHKGEAVLTAAQAEDWRAGRADSAGGLSASTISAIGTAIAQAVAQALNGTSVLMDGQSVGNLVTDTVSRNIAEGARSTRRYAVV